MSLFIRISSLHSTWNRLLSNFSGNKSFIVNINKESTRLRCFSRNTTLANEVVPKSELLKSKTKEEKDRLLFFYENPRFFIILNGFALIQFFFWGHLSEFTYRKMKDVKARSGNIGVEEQLFWWQKIDFQNTATRTLASAFFFFIGYGVLATSWLFTLRSVRMLVLNKGGKSVSIVTYAPLGKTRTTVVPLEHLSCQTSRTAAKSQLPIKVKNKWFYYILDLKSGNFPNPILFDHTAGMKRTLK